MISSIYNNFIPYQNKIIGYNALQNNFIILENELYDLYIAAVNEQAIDKFKKIHNDFYEFMIEKGFFVSEEKKEFEEVLALQKKIDHRKDFFDLFINPTMNCNFKCWYCYETHIKNSKMSSHRIKNIEKLLQNIILSNKELKTIYISWFGGEPLLQYQDVIKPILKKAKTICDDAKIIFKSGFTTNGLLINQEMIDYFKLYNVDQLQITLDGKKELHNRIRYISKNKGSYDKIVENIILLVKNHLEVIVRINCTDETLKDLDTIMYDFSSINKEYKKYIKFTFHRVWQVENSLDEDISYFIKKYKNKDFSVDGVTLDSFRDSCYADKINQAFINYNGEVFKCSARDFTDDNKEGLLDDKGTILWNHRHEERMNIKYTNKPCQTCRILPLCGGGCTQVALESKGKDYCINDFDENKKNKKVLDVFLSRISMDHV